MLPVPQHNDDGTDDDTAASNAHPNDDAHLLVTTSHRSVVTCHITRLS